VREKKQPDKVSIAAEKQNFVDTVALVAAVLWFVIIVLFSWHRDNIQILTAIERALGGSIIIYLIAFAAFHVMIRAALREEQKLQQRSFCEGPQPSPMSRQTSQKKQ
jgi:hypothetical protein